MIQLKPALYLKDGKAVSDLTGASPAAEQDAVSLAGAFQAQGADGLLIFDLSGTDSEHDRNIGIIRRICEETSLPVTGALHVKRLEDIKKLLYAGCRQACVDLHQDGWKELLEEASARFGSEKTAVLANGADSLKTHKSILEQYTQTAVVFGAPAALNDMDGLDVTLVYPWKDAGDLAEGLALSGVKGAGGGILQDPAFSMHDLRLELISRGLDMQRMLPSFEWKDLKTGPDGLIPVVVQDARNLEVLMAAYMNEEAYYTTLATGRMTYFSRSRKELWVKGLTSGHFQYVQSLAVDCDRDTILARVEQIGAACHTGNRSCFYTPLAAREQKISEDRNPLEIFRHVYDVIMDRKVHPKEGSYTNYLFDKGIDKILKKVGEECTEIVIAAKNPDKEEIKYEISDFLYHLMVLMAEKDVTWEDITRELARR